MSKFLDGKRVLITGGTGSLGQALVQRLMTGELGEPEKIVIFSRDEAKQFHMKMHWTQKRFATQKTLDWISVELLEFRIGDVCNYVSLLEAVRETQIIFHTAAMKQVPTCEYFPFEAVRTNTIGVYNLIRAVRERPGVELVVGMSTDKACKPINVMGMTKALQERILIMGNLSLSRTRLLCVRYGNVISSRGSVIPLFQDQIRSGGPVTITMPEMTRFLLTLRQAVDTVFAVAFSGKRGEIYVPRVPSAMVCDIAEALIAGRNIPLVHIGIRAGEKIHEILISEEEICRTSVRDGYFVIQPFAPELMSEPIKQQVLKTEYSSRDQIVQGEELNRLLGTADFHDFALENSLREN